MINNTILKLYRKTQEAYGNFIAIGKAIESAETWLKQKKLMEKQSKIYEIWYRRSGRLSHLLGVKVYTL